jgi:antitoxin PrlF
MDVTVVVGRQGRMVIPAKVRAALGIQPGDELHLHLAGRQLVLERPDDALDQLRGLAADVPASRSLVEELLDERRREAAEE